MSEALFKQNTGQQDYTPSSAVSAGEIEALSDGRAGFAKTDLAASVKGAVYTGCICDVASASATTFSAGAPVYWDVSASAAIGEASAEPADVYLGTAVAAKTSGQLVVRVDLNARPYYPGVYKSKVVEFDVGEAAGLNVKVDLIPAAWNKAGILVLVVLGHITEQMAGSSEDQGIVTVYDTAGTPNTICTLTPSDAAADAVGDVVLGTTPTIGSATGVANVYNLVAAGLGVKGAITQNTAGTPAGKIKVFVLWTHLT